MKKIVKKYGNSYVIILDSEDMKIYDLKAGDIVNIEDMVKVEKNTAESLISQKNHIPEKDTTKSQEVKSNARTR